MSGRGRHLARYTLVFAALAVCLWFALGVRQAEGLSGAQSILGSTVHHLKPSAVRQARAAIAEAAILDPGNQVTIDRGLLALDLGQRRRGASLLLRAAEQEPQNVQGWAAVFEDVHNTGTQLYVRTLIARLDPLAF